MRWRCTPASFGSSLEHPLVIEGRKLSDDSNKPGAGERRCQAMPNRAAVVMRDRSRRRPRERYARYAQLGFWFFLLKGLAWLLLPALGLWLGVTAD